jgi:hypothetical protein
MRVLTLINAWESIRKNIKISDKDNLGYHRLKHNKPWFDDECSKLTDQRKQARLQWLQNSSQISGDNLQNLRRETSRTFRNKKREYLKGKINELETNNRSVKLFGFISVGSVVTDLLRIKFSTFGRYWRKNGSIMGRCICCLLTSRKLMTQLREKFFTIFCLNLVYLRS